MFARPAGRTSSTTVSSPWPKATGMPFDISWRTQPGSRTGDNRDCAGVGLRGDEALCIVADGSTRGRGSGELARDLARGLIDRFVAGALEPTGPGLIGGLRALHGELTPGRA